MTLDDIRRLSLRDAGNWPLGVKAAALAALFLVIIAIGGALDWRDQYEALTKAQDEEVKLRDAYSTKKAKAVNLELYVQQLKEVVRESGINYLLLVFSFGDLRPEQAMRSMDLLVREVMPALRVG